MSGSTYITLVNELLVERNEPELTTANFDEARGIHKHAKNAVNNALREIDSYHFYWPFNLVRESTTLNAYTELFTLPSNCKIVDMESFRLKHPTTGVYTKLDVLDKDEWSDKYSERDLKNIDDASNGNTPIFVIKDNSNLRFTPVPDVSYGLKYNYFKKFTPLSNDTDVCNVPVEYNHVILNGGLKYLNIFLDNIQTATVIDSMQFKPALKQMRTLLINDDITIRDRRI